MFSLKALISLLVITTALVAAGDASLQNQKENKVLDKVAQ
jgi:hypothetical protein